MKNKVLQFKNRDFKTRQGFYELKTYIGGRSVRFFVCGTQTIHWNIGFYLWNNISPRPQPNKVLRIKNWIPRKSQNSVTICNIRDIDEKWNAVAGPGTADPKQQQIAPAVCRLFPEIALVTECSTGKSKVSQLGHFNTFVKQHFSKQLAENFSFVDTKSRKSWYPFRFDLHMFPACVAKKFVVI